MPPVPPNLPAVSRIVCHYTSTTSGVTAVNVFHVLSSGATNLDVFNRFTTAWDVNQLATMSQVMRLTTIDVTKLDNLSATETFSTTGVKFDGGVVGEFSPQVAMLIKYTTGFRGLASAGNTYVPCIGEAAQESGRLLAASLPGQITAWTNFVNTLTTQTIPLQVVSYGRFDHPTLPDAPATNHTVTAVAVDPILATQRKRQSRLRG